jgi:MHS family proline/betaine transporter-like MFS transporter
MRSSEPTALRRNVVAGTVGNVLEWYDFAVYGYLAPIIGKVFFPGDDPTSSLLAAFGVFAVGFLARPIGGMIFGHFGDKIGRKRVLIISVLMMGAGTFAIGVLPGFAQIGAASAALLVILRILQGISVGGEYAGSVVFLAEHAPPKHRGFLASWPDTGSVLGFLLGSGIGALISWIIGEAALEAWGWRIPFLLGALIAVVGIVFRRQMTESPVCADMMRVAGSPVVAALRHHWRPILQMISLILVNSIGFYMMFVYAVSYLTEQMHVSTARALDINTASLLVMLVVTPTSAALSDKIGRKPLLYFVSLSTLILAWPLWALMHYDNIWAILAGQAGFAMIFGVGYAVTSSVMVEMLPAHVRCSGVAIGYNICLGLFGGTTPLVATYLVARTADDFAPVYYLMAAAAISFAVTLGLPETARKPLL